MRMRDLDIRRLLRRHLIGAFGSDPTALIVDELGVCCGKVRVDMAVVNGELKGFEIKSDQDTLIRLPLQIATYGKVFDTLTIIVGPRHLQKIQAVVPPWWGIVLAEYHGDAQLDLRCVRTEGVNQAQDPLALTQLLWRDEALALLQANNLDAGLGSQPRRYLWEALATRFGISDLRAMVRRQLKMRRGWRVAASRTRYGEKSLPSAKSLGSQSSRDGSRTHKYIDHPS